MTPERVLDEMEALIERQLQIFEKLVLRQVTPQEGETCQSILDYLNTPNSAGKNYCGDTTIRGGWQQTSCSTRGQAGPAR